jgi:S-adenosylmethionine hydrolase
VAIEVAGGNGVLIGPDNGLLASAVALAGGAERCVVLDDESHHLEAPGATFAGRDVFAPIAALLCNGVDLADLGTPIDPALLLPGIVPLPREEGGSLHGEITWVDRYGNCQLNISPDEVAVWGDRLRVSWGETVRSMPIVSAFGEIGAGGPGLVVDGNGMLSIALDRASAAGELGLGVGDGIVVGPGDDPAGVTTPVQIRST